MGVKEKFSTLHGVVLNFSEARDNYYTAYKYVTKQDTDVYLSPGHPILMTWDPKKCVRAYRESSSRIRAQQDTSVQNKTNKINKIRRLLSTIKVSEFLIKNDKQN